MPTSFSYPVPEAPSAPPAAGSSARSRPYLVASGRAFLGFGLLTPFRRDQKGDFAAGEEAELVLACVAQVLGTRCSAMTPYGAAQGELPWRPTFGSRLYTLAHRNLDDPVTQQLARVYASDALEQWEPRFKVHAALVSKRKSAPGVPGVDTLVVRVQGDIIRANVPGNNVLVAGALLDAVVG